MPSKASCLKVIVLSIIAILLLLLIRMFSPAAVRFTDNYSDSGIDVDNNGLFDTLNVEIEVIVTRSGDYAMGATLSSRAPTPMRKDIDGSQVWVYLGKGIQTVHLAFEGKHIRLSKIDGPYLLSDIWVTDIRNPSPVELREHVIDSRADSYQTFQYRHTDFQGP